MAAFLAACITGVVSQPVGCTDDTECPSGYYCETTSCKECLRCDDLNRESPQPPTPCVKSVLECGSCYKGLIMDFRLDQRACVSPTTQEDPGPPSYIWIYIGLAIAFAISLIAFFVYVLFKRGKIMHILKIRATTSVSPSTGPVPSAPEMMPPPPAYDDVYGDRAASPDPTYAAHATEEDASRPFIKLGAGAVEGGQRTSAARQEALPFNNPAYIRGLPSDIPSEESDPGSPLPPHDEETMESFWSPHEPADNNNITHTEEYTVDEGVDGTAEATAPAATGAAAGPLLPRTRRAVTSATDAPPAKALCVRQDSTGSAESAEEASRGGAAGVVVYINNVTNVTLPR